MVPFVVVEYGKMQQKRYDSGERDYRWRNRLWPSLDCCGLCLKYGVVTEVDKVAGFGIAFYIMILQVHGSMVIMNSGLISTDSCYSSPKWAWSSDHCEKDNYNVIMPLKGDAADCSRPSPFLVLAGDKLGGLWVWCLRRGCTWMYPSFLGVNPGISIKRHEVYT